MGADVATASVDLLQLKKRQYMDLAFRALRKVAGGPVGSPSSLLLLPAVDSMEALRDLVNRMAWYLPPGTTDSVDVRVPIDASALSVPDDLDSLEAPPHQPKYPASHLPIEFVPRSRFHEGSIDADAVLLWEASAVGSSAALRNLRNAYIVDPEFYSHREPNTWGTISRQVRRDGPDRSAANFERIEATATGYEAAYVFATGPSISRAFEFEFPDDALTVICNSIVKNEDLLEHIDPDVLTFADPVFHFGPSRYADTFRRDAARAIERYECTTIVPRRFHGLLRQHFPALTDYLVGMTARSAPEPLYPTHDALEVMDTGNIMTRLMLPVASSLADDVYVIGADGREETDSYFWKHSDDAQYEDGLMETAFVSHPSFFRDRVYEDYYDEHVRTLTDMIAHGEDRGVQYHSLTDSHIQCLQDRRIAPDDAP